jgi:hypothetical protein
MYEASASEEPFLDREEASSRPRNIFAGFCVIRGGVAEGAGNGPFVMMFGGCVKSYLKYAIRAIIQGDI